MSQLADPSSVNSDVGTINWLQTDTSAYEQDQTVWRTVQTNVTGGYLSGNEQPDLPVQLDAWSAKIGTDNVGGSSIIVNLDPYYPGIYMPSSQARLIRKSCCARGARRREQAQLADREGALREDLAHDRADLSGGADDGDVQS